MIKGHTTIGARILSGSKVALLRVAEEIALSHHERWDGSGYPHALSGQHIPLSARIVGLADTLDAMTHPRRYKPTYSLDEALDYVASQRGKQFDPALVDVLLAAPSQEVRALTGA
jgi:putative two-component system response regulator